MEAFVEKTVRGRARTVRGETCAVAQQKKREISRTLFSINLHFLVVHMSEKKCSHLGPEEEEAQLLLYWTNLEKGS